MRGSRAFFVAFLMLALGCSPTTPADPAPVCIDAGIGPSCAPAYAPNYDTIYANTFQPSCAKSGVSCHGGEGVQGGVNFDNADNAYEAMKSGKKFRAGEPECSPLVHRVVATDGNFRMPPGRQLDAGEECAIVQWIAAGATRR